MERGGEAGEFTRDWDDHICLQLRQVARDPGGCTGSPINVCPRSARCVFIYSVIRQRLIKSNRRRGRRCLLRAWNRAINQRAIASRDITRI